MIDNDKATKGSLLVAGTGIQAIRHITLEAKQAIESYEKILYLVSDPITGIWIKKLRPEAQSLAQFYVEGMRRSKIYSEIVEFVIEFVRKGFRTCLVLDGHPGVFTRNISQVLIRKAHEEGFNAYMFPGISAEDCLFADLCVDPASNGCQSFEATNFLLYRRRFDTRCHLILWQIGAIGDMGFNPAREKRSGLILLTDFLEKHYSPTHEVIVYQAAQFSICKPIIQRIQLHTLTEAYVDYITTLYVPPVTTTELQLDYEMAKRLGLNSEFQPMKFNFSIRKLLHLNSSHK